MGFVLRLTELNGYDTPTWITQQAGLGVVLDCTAFFNESVDLSSLARLAGITVADIESLRYPVDKNSDSTYRRLFYNLPVPQYVIRPKLPKVCPQCLREEPYCRKIWDFALITVCPIHRCMLLDECPNCSKRLTWVRNGISICPCGSDWQEYISPLIEDSELEIAKQIHQLCCLPIGGVAGKLRDAEKSNPLYQVDLRYFVSALLFVASQCTNIIYERGKRLIDTAGKHFAPTSINAEIHALLHKGWAVFHDWPDNYFRFLEWRRSQPHAGHYAFGLNREFIQYKSALYQQLASDQLDFMRTAFEEYVATKWDGGYTSHVRRLSETVRKSSKYASRKEAKEFLRMTVEGIDKLIALGKLKAVVRKQGRSKLILIERVSLTEVKRELEHSLYLKQVVKLLGISKKRVLELVDCSLLNPLRSANIDERSDWRFSEEEVKCLLSRIAEKAVKTVTLGSGSTIDFVMALRRLYGVNVGAGQFIIAVLEEMVRPCGLSKRPGVASLIFNKSHILKYAKEQERAKMGEIFSPLESAKLIGVTLNNIYFLLRKKILHIHSESRRGYKGVRVSRANLDCFNATYVLPAKVARQLGTVSRHLTNLLIARGVKPVSGPIIDGGKQYIFKKADIEQIDLNSLWVMTR